MTALDGPPERIPALQPADDRRHRPTGTERTRESLFWQTTLPAEGLALQVYLYVGGRGNAGYNVAVWGADEQPLALHLGGGAVPDGMDFDNFQVDALQLRQPEPLRTAELRVRTEELDLDLAFEALHAPFSFHDNPDGLPAWFATNRFEQTGRISGSLRVGRRIIDLGPLGHRDHSWGPRDWRAPQHWKWLVAYTPTGRVVNGWIWIARGTWGFAGYVLRDGRPVAVRTIEERTTYRQGLRQQHLQAVLTDVEGGKTSLELDVFGLLCLPDERSGTEVREGACRATIDGEPGAGQFETLWPLDYLRRAGERP